MSVDYSITDHKSLLAETIILNSRLKDFSVLLMDFFLIPNPQL